MRYWREAQTLHINPAVEIRGNLIFDMWISHCVNYRLAVTSVPSAIHHTAGCSTLPLRTLVVISCINDTWIQTVLHPPGREWDPRPGWYWRGRPADLSLMMMMKDKLSLAFFSQLWESFNQCDIRTNPTIHTTRELFLAPPQSTGGQRMLKADWLKSTFWRYSSIFRSTSWLELYS